LLAKLVGVLFVELGGGDVCLPGSFVCRSRTLMRRLASVLGVPLPVPASLPRLGGALTCLVGTGVGLVDPPLDLLVGFRHARQIPASVPTQTSAAVGGNDAHL
jgi:hypothetical protein